MIIEVTPVASRFLKVKEETRQLVKAVIEIIGYVPNPQARGLAFCHSLLSGLIYDNPNPQCVVNTQHGFLLGIKGSGHQIVVHPCDKNSINLLNDARSFVINQ